MTYYEFYFNHTKEYDELKSIFSNINEYTHDHSKNIKFNLSSGDITSGIKWIWASNRFTLNYFQRFFDSINLEKKLKTFCDADFIIRGASFIVLEQSKVENSEFHYDAFSHYDTSDTNILTIIFPLYKIDETLGNLEYKGEEDINVYKYHPNKIIVWDSSKFLHRTQPYQTDIIYKRVLVSVNLSTDQEWAINTINLSLKHQGNILWI